MESAEKEKHTNVLYELVLQDRLVSGEVKSKLLRAQSQAQKWKLIRSHTKLKTNEVDEEGNGESVWKLDYCGSLEDYKTKLCKLRVAVRTADRSMTKRFFTESAASFFERLEDCARKEPSKKEEVEIVHVSLLCLNDLSDNPFGSRLMLDNGNSVFALVLVSNPLPEVVQQNTLIETQRLLEMRLENTILAMEILVRLAWERPNSSRMVLQEMEKVTSLRRLIGGPLAMLKIHYADSTMFHRNVFLLTKLCVQICEFLNSLIELEDELLQRQWLREEIDLLDLFTHAHELAERISSRPQAEKMAMVDVSNRIPLNPRQMSSKYESLDDLCKEVFTQLQVFQNRRQKDKDLISQTVNNPLPSPPPSPELSPSPSSTFAHSYSVRSVGSPIARSSTAPTSATNNHDSNNNNAGRSVRSPSFKETFRLNNEWKRLFEFLQRISLDRYIAVLIENGFDSLDRLQLIDPFDMKELGIKRGHQKALAEALFQLKVSEIMQRKHVSRTVAQSMVTIDHVQKQQQLQLQTSLELESPTSLASKQTGSKKKDGEDNEEEEEEDGALSLHRQRRNPHSTRLSRPFTFKVIPSSVLTVMEKIGSGTFGDVHKCIYHGAVCVVKRVKRSSRRNNHLSNQDILEEAEAMELAKNHPHVVSLYGVCLDTEEISLVSEFCEIGSLFDVVVVAGESKVSFEEALELARQGVCGLAYLHSENIVHRDIAARNFLIHRDGTVKVCDFGLAKIKHSTSTDSFCGSGVHPIRWAAPESLEKKVYSTQSDVYMCGVFLWELWFRSVPYPKLQNNADVFTKVVLQHEHPDLPPNAVAKHPDLAALLKRCWAYLPSERPNMTQVLQDLDKCVPKSAQLSIGSGAWAFLSNKHRQTSLSRVSPGYSDFGEENHPYEGFSP